MSLLLSQSPIIWPTVFMVFAAGYLSGSVPYGLLLTRFAGMGDIRNIGSGNIGATNVLRTGNKKLAGLTLLLDALKGTIPVLIALQFHMDYAVLVALGAFIGHLFPIWLKFKGGKGVATALGICFAFSIWLGLALIAVWLAVAYFSKYSSGGALAAFGFAPLLAGLITADYQITITVLIIAILVWIRHHENIRRLLNGTESKINLKKST